MTSGFVSSPQLIGVEVMFRANTWSLALGLCALALAGVSTNASIVTGTGTASTSNKGTVSTTTTGQKQILCGIDPFGTFSFQLDYSFEVGKVAFDTQFGVQ